MYSWHLLNTHLRFKQRFMKMLCGVVKQFFLVRSLKQKEVTKQKYETLLLLHTHDTGIFSNLISCDSLCEFIGIKIHVNLCESIQQSLRLKSILFGIFYLLTDKTLGNEIRKGHRPIIGTFLPWDLMWSSPDTCSRVQHSDCSLFSFFFCWVWTRSLSQRNLWNVPNENAPWD